MNVVLTKNAIDRLNDIVNQELLNAGAEHVMIIDTAGNLIMERGSLNLSDIPSLAVLLAANFAATAQIAQLIGENDFSLLFHKGDKTNIHFSKLGNSYIIITLFDDNVSLGLIRLRSTGAIKQLLHVLDGAASESLECLWDGLNLAVK